MLLPNADRAFIDLAKLTDYCRSPTHSVGKHKARVFQSALGLAASDADQLAAWILQGILVVEAETDRADDYGQRYNVDLPMSTDHGSAVVRTAWIIRILEDFPRLVTCFVLVEGE